ncbi:MAG TPA: pyrroloquinoline quinone biosynthesis protein PqqB [Candidatus Binatia bacterium]|jgi:pyrroloquinoline quinone biosynthesis protein B|nr:pyrroloquinoline quinone biosynthesis protein PqqB [Candidatus Binatia bacterium]
MRITLLGTAAGGGVPQWNCNCAVCHEARRASGRVTPRTQSSVALSADGRSWFLLNASPDIRQQIEGCACLRPPAGKKRGSPIHGVLLTNADLDHTLGLFLLREGERLTVHAATAVRQSLAKGLSVGSTLDCFCGVEWVQPPAKLSPLLRRDGSSSGLLYQAVALGGKPPRFFKRRAGSTLGHVVGYRIVDQKTGGRLLFLLDVAALDKQVQRLLPECDALLFDGTFWTNNEMKRRGVGALTAAQMGHVPISGPGGSLKALAALQPKPKIYTHINNTNPILVEDSPEHAAVLAAGCLVGCDGMEIVI